MPEHILRPVFEAAWSLMGLNIWYQRKAWEAIAGEWLEPYTSERINFILRLGYERVKGVSWQH